MFTLGMLGSAAIATSAHATMGEDGIPDCVVFGHGDKDDPGITGIMSDGDDPRPIGIMSDDEEDPGVIGIMGMCSFGGID